jgi:hypothetical protein
MTFMKVVNAAGLVNILENLLHETPEKDFKISRRSLGPNKEVRVWDFVCGASFRITVEKLGDTQ